MPFKNQRRSIVWSTVVYPEFDATNLVLSHFGRAALWHWFITVQMGNGSQQTVVVHVFFDIVVTLQHHPALSLAGSMATKATVAVEDVLDLYAVARIVEGESCGVALDGFGRVILVVVFFAGKKDTGSQRGYQQQAQVTQALCHGDV